MTPACNQTQTGIAVHHCSSAQVAEVTIRRTQNTPVSVAADQPWASARSITRQVRAISSGVSQRRKQALSARRERLP